MRQAVQDVQVEIAGNSGFNVFNNRGTTSVATAYDNPDGTVREDDTGVLFGQQNGRQGPRYFQLGLRGEF